MTGYPKWKAFFFSAVASCLAIEETTAQDYHARSLDPRPNVIIIYADDLGYGDLGSYGHPTFQTPELDRMANEGARLTSFYTTCPFCTPSRASLLTGRYQFRSRMHRNLAPTGPLSNVGMPDSEILLGEAFSEAGYRTICIGKWHLGHQPRYNPKRHGFDEYFGILYSNDMRPVRLMEGLDLVEYPVVQATLTQRYTERALRFIEENKHSPFFMYLPHAMPHKPLAATEEFYTPETPEDLYADVMRELDWSVGSLLRRLRELKLDRRTLVVFTSDNGPWFGGSSGGLRGMKGTTWEGGYRVPMIAWMPGSIPAGLESAQPAATIDLYPTVLNLCKIPVPSDRVIDGRDIWELLTLPGTLSPHEALFCMRGSRLSTIRSGKWKLHIATTPDRPGFLGDIDPEDWADGRGPDGVTLLAPYEQYGLNDYPYTLGGDKSRPMMLFDLESDRAERHDVSAQNPQVVARLKKLYEAMQAQIPNPL